MTRKIIAIIFIVMAVASPAFADQVYPFSGKMDLLNKQLEFVLGLDTQSFISAKAKQLTSNDYKLTINVEHLKLSKFDFSSEVESTLSLRSKDPLSQIESPRAVGSVTSHYSLIDYKPSSELHGNFDIKDKMLHFDSLDFGQLHFKGNIDLNYPFKVDLALHIDPTNLQDFFNSWIKDNNYQLGGDVSGDIKIAGPLQNLILRGNFRSLNGYISDLQYEKFLLNIEGVYPNIQIAQSTITGSDGMSFALNGSMNLHDLASFQRQFESLKIAPIVNESNSKVEWTIKSSKEEKGKTELKYLLKKNTEGSNNDEPNALIGVQRSLEF